MIAAFTPAHCNGNADVAIRTRPFSSPHISYTHTCTLMDEMFASREAFYLKALAAGVKQRERLLLNKRLVVVMQSFVLLWFITDN